MKNENKAAQITKGMIVKYQEGNYRVTCVKGGKVNLGAIFSSNIYHKGIPVELVVDDEAAWYERWTQSEAYMCTYKLRSLDVYVKKFCTAVA